MKKLLGLLLFCFGINGMAQSVTFEYDAAGNQIKRQYSLSGRYSSEPIKEYKDVTNEDLIKFFPEDVISYYPNPVKDELYLKWELINENKVLNIQIYNINGQVIKTINNIEENKTIISFQEYTSGTYLVNLNYSSGEQKSIKIIKN
jgi:flagellar hook assembly protein FlgD